MKPKDFLDKQLNGESVNKTEKIDIELINKKINRDFK